MERLSYFLMIFVWTFISCGGNDDGPDTPDPVPAPGATSLVFPENNTECNEGTILSDTESTVSFRWNAAANTDEYTLRVENLDSNSVQSVSTSNTTLDLTIQRATPYAWSIVSRANGTDQTAQSPTWRFYNAGLAVENYAPFPAEIVSPAMGATVVAGTITIAWQGNDVDNDIVSYDLYLGQTSPPETLVSSSSDTSFDTEIVSGERYYWMVVTHDENGNRSNSEIFEFRVN